MERATGFEPANTSLGSWGLTTWRCPRRAQYTPSGPTAREQSPKLRYCGPYVHKMPSCCMLRREDAVAGARRWPRYCDLEGSACSHRHQARFARGHGLVTRGHDACRARPTRGCCDGGRSTRAVTLMRATCRLRMPARVRAKSWGLSGGVTESRSESRPPRLCRPHWKPWSIEKTMPQVVSVGMHHLPHTPEPCIPNVARQ